MQKSADAFRTISEVADDLSLPQHVLRFWETRFPQIRPLKRAGGRRYYRPNDVTLLRAIRQLLYDDGYTIKGVQRLLKEQGIKGLATPPSPDLPDLEDDALAPAGDHISFDDEPLAPSGDGSGAGAFPFLDGAVPRADLEHALAIVDECRRILATVRSADVG